MAHLFFELCAAASIDAALPSIVLVAAAFGLVRLCSWSAAARYYIWSFTFLAIIALPFTLPLMPSKPRPRVLPPILHIRLSKPAATVMASALLEHHSRTAPSFDAVDAAGYLCIALVLVQIARFGKCLISVFHLKRMVVEYNRPAEHETTHRRYGIVVSDRVPSPTTIGYFRPLVILPAQLVNRLDGRELRAVISHEQAHVARYDDWAISVERFLAALFAFHPLVHFISQRMDREREMACDDYALLFTTPRQYAECLTKVAQIVRIEPSFATTLHMLRNKSSLEERIEIMLHRTRSHVASPSKLRTFAFSVLAIGVSIAATRIPTLVASPLADAQAGELGPIVLTAPDGSLSTFGQEGIETTRDSGFPPGTIVFKSNGQNYIIRDPSTVRQAAKLNESMSELSRHQRELGEKQSELGDVQRKLGEHMREIDQVQMDAATQKIIEEKLEQLKERLNSTEMRQALEHARDAQAQLGDLQSRLAELQARLAEQSGAVALNEQKLGEEMGKIGGEMSALSAAQERVASAQALETKHIEERIRRLVDEALKKGLAQPLP